MSMLIPVRITVKLLTEAGSLI